MRAMLAESLVFAQVFLPDGETGGCSRSSRLPSRRPWLGKQWLCEEVPVSNGFNVRDIRPAHGAKRGEGHS